MRVVLTGVGVLFALLHQSAIAQTRDTDTLQEVGVRSNRKGPSDMRAAVFSPGLKTAVLDSALLRLYTQQTLATLLSEQSSVFIKSYGFNALATLNFRGASAAQSLVLWNGVPMQNAALGLADVSLVPVSLMDKVSVLYGASAGLWGSGAVGGAVLLESDAARYQSGYRRVDASGSLGSFGQRGGLVRGDISGGKYALSVRAFAQQADNDFWIPATLFSPREQQRNAMLRAGGALARGAVKISAREMLEAHVWVQQYNRQIPRATFESSSEKTQTDQNLRALLHYRRQGTTELAAKVAGFFDELQYEDPVIRLSSLNQSRQFYGEASARRKFGKGRQFDALLLMPIQLSQMTRADGTHATQRRVAMSAVGKAHLFENRLEAAGSARLEAIDEKTVFLPGVSTAFELFPQLTLRAAVQKTYRAPTLSERYYNPGGNVDLKSEDGWGGEASYVLNHSGISGLRFRQEATVFHRYIRNWILWFGGAIWTPHNVAAVRSQGIELDNRLTVRISSKRQIVVTANGALTRARTLESELPGDVSVGKQLPYTPRLLGQASVGIYLHHFLLNYQHAYTGVRYVTTDESYGLPAYHTGTINAMWEGSIRKHISVISVRLANLWNAEYAVVAGRPMPRRHVMLTLRVGFL